MGQFGNQLFQIAAALSLAQENNDIFSHDWYCFCSKQDLSKFFKNKLHAKINDPKIEYVYNENPFGGAYNKIIYKKNMDLFGFFQSEKYFETNKDLIKHYFEPEDVVINNLSSKYDKLINSNSCSIHVRMYHDSPFHQICNMNYFNKAINLINSKEKIDNFLVFSNDIPWCKKNLSSKFSFIEGNHFVEDMFLMSLCKHNIICNSSFSWWGSWLNKNSKKVIISPNKWVPDELNKDIFREDMIRISL